MTYTTTLPDGKIATKNSKTRAFTFATAVRFGGGDWAVYGWATSEKTTRSQISEARRNNAWQGGFEAVVLPAKLA